MKDLIISGVHIVSQEGERIVYDALSRLSPHFDIALVSHTFASERILKKVKYFIYDERNELMYKNIGTTYWGTYPTFDYEIHPGNRAYHSFAAYRSLTNAVKLLSHEYDSFIYADGDSIFSEDDISKIKEIKTTANNNNCDAAFFSNGDFFSNYVFFCKMEFFKNAFTFFKNSDEFLRGCAEVGGYGDMENYLYKSVQHKGMMNKVYLYKNTNVRDYLKSSKINMNTFSGTAQNGAAYTFDVLRVDGTENELGCFYINHMNYDGGMLPVYLDGEFITNVPNRSCALAFKVNPKNEIFDIDIGSNKFTFDKSKILDKTNRSIVRLK